MGGKTILLPVLAFGFLWLVLINQLRVEWANNPQYAYGWAVPFLCLYLLWQRLRTSNIEPPAPQVHLPSSIFHLLFLLLALAYAPTRLVQEASPAWRLPTWLLGLEVVGLTLLFLHLALRTSNLALRISHLAFPVCFFLVAIPWPRGLMKLVVLSLAGLNVSLTTEALGWFGVVAVQHGNVIEVGTGVVGIDEACSGIRSFQATLMISLFLGELYRLSVLRRMGCVLAGFGLAFLFNAGRTFVLVWVAARKGVEAIAHWHDPAGVTILVGCFLALWLAALALRQRSEGVLNAERGRRNAEWGIGEHSTLNAERGRRNTELGMGEHSTLNIQHSTLNAQPSSIRRLSLGLLAWLLFVEFGIGIWYRHLESNLPRGPEWTIVWPEDNPTFEELPMSVWVRDALKFNAGRQAAWQDLGGIKWQVFYFHWFPGKAAGYLAKRHTPEVCLPSAGLSLRSASELMFVDVQGLRLPVRRYVFADGAEVVHVLYCRWEEGIRPESYVNEKPTFLNIIRGVWAGRGNLNQKVLEVVVWGIPDDKEAEAATLRQLEKLVKVESPKK